LERWNSTTPTYWLSMHVRYACRDAGACCSSGWPIPIERIRVGAVRGLRPDMSWLRVVDEAPPDIAGALALSSDGHCVFHRERCDIQRRLGARAMPAACQHFPRQVILDRRGVFVSLSHFCPTAADLLFTHTGSVAIVPGPPAIPDGEPEGLDARDVMPPLLDAGVLMDLESYSAWERHVVSVLGAAGGLPADAALRRLEDDLRSIQRWRPGATSLTEVVNGLDASGQGSDDAFDVEDLVVRRYLAARAFASPAAYGRAGIAAVLGTLRQALSLLRGLRRRLPLKEAIRETDRQLLHQGEPVHGSNSATTGP
jgi:hypothetical protein